MHRILIAILMLSCMLALHSSAQGTGYSIKGGLSACNQQWDNNIGNRNLLFSYHVAGVIDNETEDGSAGLFLQFGYHNRGSAVRTTLYSPFNNNSRQQNTKYIFHNLSLVIGAKSAFNKQSKYDFYYRFGLRGDVTIGTNLNEFEQSNQCYPIQPTNDGVNKIMGGFYLGAGYETEIAPLIKGFVELSISPDYSRQYFSGPVSGVINTCGTGGLVNIPERRIINTTFELSVGIKFINKIEYID